MTIKMAALDIGTKAPDFSLTDMNGKRHTLASFPSSYIVLYFYPKDNTAGCTLEARDFSTHAENFRSHGISIVGVSGGDDASKKDFCERSHLTITLLSDTDFSVSKKYGVYGEHSFLGKKFLGISRTTFVLDANKKIVLRYDNVNPQGHASVIFTDIAKLRTAQAGVRSR